MHLAPLLIPLLMGQIEAQPAREDLEQAREAAEAAAKAPVLTRAPELLEDATPAYPPEVQAEGITGEVILTLTLSDAGLVTEAGVTKGLDPRLDAAAIEAARRLVFSPAEVDGVLASVQIELLNVPPMRVYRWDLPSS